MFEFVYISLWNNQKAQNFEKNSKEVHEKQKN